MNFISWTEGPITQLELKYCERCGGLWLRFQGDNRVYCAACRNRLAELPGTAEERHSSPRLPRPKRADIECGAQIETLQGVAEREVRL